MYKINILLSSPWTRAIVSYAVSSTLWYNLAQITNFVYKKNIYCIFLLFKQFFASIYYFNIQINGFDSIHQINVRKNIICDVFRKYLLNVFGKVPHENTRQSKCLIWNLLPYLTNLSRGWNKWCALTSLIIL